MKRWLALLVMIAAASAAAFAVSLSSLPQLSDQEKAECAAELALEFHLDVNDLHSHFRRHPEDARKIYGEFAARRLCRFYEEHRFPVAAFRRGAAKLFRSGESHAEHFIRHLEEHDAALGNAARRLAEGENFSEDDWKGFTGAFERFYRQTKLTWGAARDNILDTLHTEVAGVVEHTVLRQPIPSVPVAARDMRGGKLGQAATDTFGRFQIRIPYGDRLKSLILLVGPATEEEQEMAGLTPMGRRVQFRRAASSHVLPLAHMEGSGNLFVTVTDASTRLPLPGARVTVVQDSFSQRQVPVTGGVAEPEAGEAVSYGGTQTFVADEFGNVRFQVYAGMNTLRVEHDGYPPVTRAAHVGVESEGRVWAALSKKRRPLTLRVRDARGGAKAFARVHLSQTGHVIADGEGVILTSIDEGAKVEAKLDMPGYAPASVAVSAGDGPTEAALSAEAATVQMMGHVRDAAGRPLEGVMVFSQTTGDLFSTDAQGEFKIPVIPEKDATLLFGKEGWLAQAVRPHLTAYWMLNQRVYYMGDVTLFSDAQAAPRIEAPSEGAYVAPGALALDVRFPLHYGKTWGGGMFSLGGREAEVPYDYQLRYTWKESLPEGEHEISFEAELADDASGQSRVLRTARKFRVGEPPWFQSTELTPEGPSGQRLTVTLRKEGTSPSILDTMRVFADGEVVRYERKETAENVVLTADVPPVVVRVRLSAYDEDGRVVEFFR